MSRRREVAAPRGRGRGRRRRARATRARRRQRATPSLPTRADLTHAGESQQPCPSELDADRQPLRLGSLFGDHRSRPRGQAALVHAGGLPLDPSARLRRQRLAYAIAAGVCRHWPHDLAGRAAPRAARRRGQSTGGPCGTLLCVNWSPALRRGFALPRHPRGAALLNHKRPATPGAKGSRALLEKTCGESAPIGARSGSPPPAGFRRSAQVRSLRGGGRELMSAAGSP